MKFAPVRSFAAVAATMFPAVAAAIEVPDEVVAEDTVRIASTLERVFAEHAPWLLDTLLGIEIWRYVAAILTIALVTVLRRAVLRTIMRVLRGFAARTDNTIDDQLVDAADPPLGWFVAAFGVYAGLLWLQLPESLAHVVLVAYRITCTIIVAWALIRMSDLLTWMLRQMAARTNSSLDDHLVPLVSRISRVVVVGLAVVFVLQEFGFNVAGLVAGLGIGGVALALAAQDTVANWFGALMIYTDRPFEIGDWIKTGELEGVVEEIGLRSTRVRTFAKTVVAVPNADLAGDTVENFSRMPIRRIYVNVGVTYSTTPAMMREALERLRDILRTHPDVDPSFWLVKFNEFGASSLNIMLYFFTTTTDWERYLSIREDVFLQIMQTLDDLGVAFAFPSQSLYLESPDSAEIAELDARARRLYAARVHVDDSHHAMTAPSDHSGS